MLFLFNSPFFTFLGSPPKPAKYFWHQQFFAVLHNTLMALMFLCCRYPPTYLPVYLTIQLPTHPPLTHETRYLSIYLSSQLTTQAKETLQKLIHAQPVKNSSRFMEHEGPSPCSKQPTNSPSHEPDDPRPHPSNLFHYAQFYYYPPIYDKVSHVVSFLQVSPTNPNHMSIPPHTGEKSRPSNAP